MELRRTIMAWLEREERSQNFLARKAGLDSTYLSTILNGHRKPGSKVLAKLERAMGLSAGSLSVEQPRLPGVNNNGHSGGEAAP